MLQLLLFLKRHLRTLLFILFEACALYVYAGSTSYAQARMLVFSNSCIGVITNSIAGVGHYFSLKEENRQLAQNVAELNNALQERTATHPTGTGPNAETGLQENTAGIEPVPEMTATAKESVAPYYYTSARVLRNTVSKRDNYFIIDKGSHDGILPDMAVVTTDARAVGFVMECTEHFSVCMSMLNSHFSLGGILKGKDYFGFLKWENEDSRHIALNDIPVYAEVAKGDTILSTISFRFPPDMMIGTVDDFKVSDNVTNYDIRLNLAVNFGRLSHVLVVKYNDAEEMKEVEEKIDTMMKQ